MRKGSLTIVGTGLALAGQVTQEALSAIQNADRFLYLVSDIVTATWLDSLNPTAESLYGAYAEGRPREETYAEIVERILARLREGGHVVVAFYGHPGVFVGPSHEAIRLARAEGFAAQMLPGISARRLPLRRPGDRSRRARLPELRSDRLPAAPANLRFHQHPRPLADRRHRRLRLPPQSRCGAGTGSRCSSESCSRATLQITSSWSTKRSPIRRFRRKSSAFRSRRWLAPKSASAPRSTSRHFPTAKATRRCARR